MVRNPVPRKWTVEEYVQYEQETDLRHEYLDGEIYAMSGGTARHSAIIVNTTLAIGKRLTGSPCRAFSGDMKVRINDSKYVYPDLSAVCGQAQFEDDRQLVLTNPILCVVVLSPSSMAYAQGLRSETYRRLSSLQHYLLIDQERVAVQLYTRHDNGWLLQESHDLDGSLHLSALDVRLPLSEIYQDITFEQA